MHKRILMVCFLILLVAPAAFAQNRLHDEKASANLTDVSFKEVSAKECVRILVEYLGFKAKFEDMLDNGKLAFELKDVTLVKALAIAVTMQDWRVKQLPEDTLLIIPNTTEASERYAKYPDWSPTKAKK